MTFGSKSNQIVETLSPEHQIFVDKLMAGANKSMDRLIIERMKINVPLILMRNGKIQEVSPFVLAKERWGDDESKYPKFD